MFNTMKDLPRFLSEKAARLAGGREESEEFISALAFVLERHEGTFEVNAKEKDEVALARYRQERTTAQIVEALPTDAQEAIAEEEANAEVEKELAREERELDIAERREAIARRRAALKDKK